MVDLTTHRNDRNLVGVNNLRGTEENSPPWSVNQYFLCKKLGIDDRGLGQALDLYLEECINPKTGMINNIAGTIDPKNKDSFLSPDQIRPWAIWSKYRGRKEHVQILDHMKSHFLTYNNLTGKTDINRLIHPREYFFLKMLNNEDTWFDRWSFNQITRHTFSTGTKTRPTLIDSMKIWVKTGTYPHRITMQKTDMELLFWSSMQIFSFDDDLLEFCNYHVTKRFGGWQNVFKTYYGYDHPTYKLAKMLYS